MNNLLKTLLLLILFNLSFSITADVFYSPIIKQGESNSILLRTNNKIISPELIYNNRKFPMHNIYFSSDKYVYRIILGTDPLTHIGKKEIKIIAENKTLKTFSFLVTKNIFQEEYIDIPQEKKVALTTKNLVNEGDLLGNKFKKISKKAKWKGEFMMPAEGKISSPYGSQRKYNKDNISWWHKGIDIANKTGTPVYAPNDGTIILTEENLAVHGKTIMIDHGQGIISVFNHLDSINAKTGDIIKKGEPLATIGNTGNSTGPHLHWGLSVNNVRVNPIQWVKARFAPNYF